MTNPNKDEVELIIKSITPSLRGCENISVMVAMFSVLSILLEESGVKEENCRRFISGGVKAFNKELEIAYQEQENDNSRN